MTSPLTLAENLLGTDPAEAATRLGGVLAETPHDVAALCLLARAQLALDRPDLALTTAAGAVTVAPADGDAQGVLSEVMTRLGRHDEAVTAARRSVAADPHRPLRHDRLARALLAARVGPAALAEAEQAARTAVELDPGSAAFQATHGLVLARRGDRPRARRALLDALMLDPGHTEARRELVDLGRTPRRGHAGAIVLAVLLTAAVATVVLVSIGGDAQMWALGATALGAVAVRAGLGR